MFSNFAATSFIEFWKRRQAVIAWEWDLTNFEDEEQTRPEYETNVKTTRINPVTRKHEPYLSPWDKAARVLFTNSFVFVMVRILKPKTSIFVLSHCHTTGRKDKCPWHFLNRFGLDEL